MQFLVSVSHLLIPNRFYIFSLSPTVLSCITILYYFLCFCCNVLFFVRLVTDWCCSFCFCSVFTLVFFLTERMEYDAGWWIHVKKTNNFRYHISCLRCFEKTRIWFFIWVHTLILSVCVVDPYSMLFIFFFSFFLFFIQHIWKYKGGI